MTYLYSLPVAANNIQPTYMYCILLVGQTGADPRQNMTISQLCSRGVCVHGPPENLSDLMSYKTSVPAFLGLKIDLFDRKRLSHNFLTVAGGISGVRLFSWKKKSDRFP